MKLAFLLSSRFGHVQAIAEHMAEVWHRSGVPISVDYLNLEEKELKVNLQQYQVIIVGASIRYGHFHRNVWRLASQYSKSLNNKKTAFYSVNLLARRAGKDTVDTNSYTRKFLATTPWKPKISRVFAGALRYPRYNWLDRLAIGLVMRITGGETNMSKEVVYTDWQAVTSFASEIAREWLGGPRAPVGE
ncbi:MAG: menaquinone-dependent protoporphyrinogen IX dehydrogenase [Neisseriaceae bacterium]